MKLANSELRENARRANVPLWRLAAEIGISEPTMTRKLRRELPDAEREKLLRIIDELALRKEAERHA